MSSKEAKVVKTDKDAINGQTHCPLCGATDISLNVNTGKLRCNFCRHEFDPKQVEGFEENIDNLNEKVVSSGAADIKEDAEDVLTLKCSSCGAEVVIDTASTMTARCHWCRSNLSINQQIPNGAVPDVVLPFQVKKEEAQAEIEKFVGKRKFFAHPKFKKEFTTENIMGVYFPYMVVDVNAHANFIGEGEILVREYTTGSDDNKKTYYDADLYSVEREFDIAIDSLTIESSKEKLNNSSKEKTNNIINSIMPFDTENAVKWDANYLRGFTSEKRDTNVSDLKDIVNAQAKDVARFSARDTLKKYDRGVCWRVEDFDVKGEQWKAAYFPVWLYSYQEKSKNKSILHYVAVNARTKETMGSVPINTSRLLFVSAIVEFFGIILAILFNNPDSDSNGNLIFLAAGFVFYLIMYLRYRNSNARHNHETETKSTRGEVRKVDQFLRSEKGLRNARILGENSTHVSGSTLTANKATKLLNNITGNKETSKTTKSTKDDNNK